MVVAPRPTGVKGNTFGRADGHISRRTFKLERGPDGHAWLHVDRTIYRIDPTTLHFQAVATDTSDSTRLRWSANGEDLLVFGGTKPGFLRLFSEDMRPLW
jgi:hypothetical protein